MQGGYVKGYANGGVAEYTGPRMPPRKPITKNPNIEAGFYDSEEYKKNSKGWNSRYAL